MLQSLRLALAWASVGRQLMLVDSSLRLTADMKASARCNHLLTDRQPLTHHCAGVTCCTANRTLEFSSSDFSGSAAVPCSLPDSVAAVRLAFSGLQGSLPQDAGVWAALADSLQILDLAGGLCARMGVCCNNFSLLTPLMHRQPSSARPAASRLGTGVQPAVLVCGWRWPLRHHSSVYRSAVKPGILVHGARKPAPARLPSNSMVLSWDGTQAGAGLSGAFPALGNLSSLVALDLSSQALTGQLPNDWLSSPQLRVLDVSRNSLRGSIPPPSVAANIYGSTSKPPAPAVQPADWVISN